MNLNDKIEKLTSLEIAVESKIQFSVFSQISVLKKRAAADLSRTIIFSHRNCTGGLGGSPTSDLYGYKSLLAPFVHLTFCPFSKPFFNRIPVYLNFLMKQKRKREDFREKRKTQNRIWRNNMTETETKNTKTEISTTTEFRQRIAKTEYIVSIHFAEGKKENLEEKILRLAKNEI